LEGVVVSFESLDWVIVGHVIHFELVNNHEGKQIEHHELNEHHKTNKIDRSVLRTTIIALGTIGAP
jgi:hypothetical protein